MRREREINYPYKKLKDYKERVNVERSKEIPKEEEEEEEEKEEQKLEPSKSTAEITASEEAAIKHEERDKKVEDTDSALFLEKEIKEEE